MAITAPPVSLGGRTFGDMFPSMPDPLKQNKSAGYLAPVKPAQNMMQQPEQGVFSKYVAPALSAVAPGMNAASANAMHPQTVGEGVLSTVGSGLSGAASGAAAGTAIAPGIGTLVGAGVGGTIGLVMGGLNSYFNYNRGKREQERMANEKAIADSRARRAESLNRAQIEENIALNRETFEFNKETTLERMKADKEQQAYINAMNLINSKLPQIQAYRQAEDAKRGRYHQTGML